MKSIIVEIVNGAQALQLTIASAVHAPLLPPTLSSEENNCTLDKCDSFATSRSTSSKGFLGGSTRELISFGQ